MLTDTMCRKWFLVGLIAGLALASACSIYFVADEINASPRTIPRLVLKLTPPLTGYTCDF